MEIIVVLMLTIENIYIVFKCLLSLALRSFVCASVLATLFLKIYLSLSKYFKTQYQFNTIFCLSPSPQSRMILLSITFPPLLTPKF